MLVKVFIIGFMLLGVSRTGADPLQAAIEQALAGLEVAVSADPYSRDLKRMYIGMDEHGKARVGVAYREIESFETITGIVIVHKTPKGFVLHEALFPDIEKIQNTRDRQQVLTVLKQFRNIPFDPHAEKSAVDGLSGATRHGLKTSGYLNYMARRIALEMENLPDWTRQRKKQPAPHLPLNAGQASP